MRISVLISRPPVKQTDAYFWPLAHRTSVITNNGGAGPQRSAHAVLRVLLGDVTRPRGPKKRPIVREVVRNYCRDCDFGGRMTRDDDLAI
jgi:hypothetical protein